LFKDGSFGTEKTRKEIEMKKIEMIIYLKRFLKEEQKPTAIEYAIMLTLVALAIALATPGIRDAVINIFNLTASALQGMVGG
jgi:Flp pilus assembly pilin Flp